MIRGKFLGCVFQISWESSFGDTINCFSKEKTDIKYNLDTPEKIHCIFMEKHLVPKSFENFKLIAHFDVYEKLPKPFDNYAKNIKQLNHPTIEQQCSY